MLEEVVWEAAIIGGFGGCARAFYGLYKAERRGKKPNRGYFVSTIIISAILGGLITALFNVDFRVAGAIGYVGSDFIENILIGILPKSIQLNQE